VRDEATMGMVGNSINDRYVAPVNTKGYIKKPRVYPKPLWKPIVIDILSHIFKNI